MLWQNIENAQKRQNQEEKTLNTRESKNNKTESFTDPDKIVLIKDETHYLSTLKILLLFNYFGSCLKRVFFFTFVWNSMKNHCIGLNLSCVIELKPSALQTTPSFKFWDTDQHIIVCVCVCVWIQSGVTQTVALGLLSSHSLLNCSDTSYKDWQWLWSLKSCQVSHWVIYWYFFPHTFKMLNLIVIRTVSFLTDGACRLFIAFLLKHARNIWDN